MKHKFIIGEAVRKEVRVQKFSCSEKFIEKLDSLIPEIIKRALERTFSDRRRTAMPRDL